MGFGYRVGAGVATAEELVEGVLAVAVRDEAHARAREPSVAERGDVEHLVRVGLGLGLGLRVRVRVRVRVRGRVRVRVRGRGSGRGRGRVGVGLEAMLSTE